MKDKIFGPDDVLKGDHILVSRKSYSMGDVASVVYVAKADGDFRNVFADPSDHFRSERPTPPVPTEPGVYLGSDGTYHFLNLPVHTHWTDNLQPVEGPYTRLEPVTETVERVVKFLDEREYVLATEDVQAEFGVSS